MTYEGCRRRFPRGNNGDQIGHYAPFAARRKIPGVVASTTCRASTSGPPKCAQVRPSRLCGDRPQPLRPPPPRQPDDVTARARASRGASDAEVMNVAAAMQLLRAQPNASGKIAVFGCCSGGRTTRRPALGIDAAVDCWGGRVIVNNPADIAPRPVARSTHREIALPRRSASHNDDKNWRARRREPHPGDLPGAGANEFHRRYDAGHSSTGTKPLPAGAGRGRLAQDLHLPRQAPRHRGRQGGGLTINAQQFGREIQE